MTEARSITLADFLLARIEEDRGEYGSAMLLGEDSLLRSLWIKLLEDSQAKRRIVYRYTHLADHGDSGDARWVLPLLALPYADHPDYREEWRPADAPTRGQYGPSADYGEG